MTNGDVQVDSAATTAAPGTEGLSLGRLHLIAEKGQSVGWLYVSSQSPGSPW